MKTIKINEFGFDEYQLNGKTHRTNGPALETYNSWGWWLYGRLHRYYGPRNSGGDWNIHGRYIKTWLS